MVFLQVGHGLEQHVETFVWSNQPKEQMHVFVLGDAELSLGFFGTNVFGMVVVQRMKEGRGIPFG